MDYGYLVLNFYHTYVPENVTCRVYCNYESYGVGWHNLSRIEYLEHSTYTNGRVIFDNPYYRCSQIEITITPKTDTTTRLTSIEYYMSRPQKLEQSFVDKTADTQNFRGKLVAGNGFSKTGYTDDQVLCAGGGTKNIKDLNVSGVYDYGMEDRVIQIGYAGAGLTTESASYLAAYTENGTKIKDLSFEVAKQILGINNINNTADADKSVKSASELTWAVFE